MISRSKFADDEISYGYYTVFYIKTPPKKEHYFYSGVFCADI